MPLTLDISCLPGDLFMQKANTYISPSSLFYTILYKTYKIHVLYMHTKYIYKNILYTKNILPSWIFHLTMYFKNHSTSVYKDVSNYFFFSCRVCPWCGHTYLCMIYKQWHCFHYFVMRHNATVNNLVHMF